MDFWSLYLRMTVEYHTVKVFHCQIVSDFINSGDEIPFYLLISVVTTSIVVLS